MSKNLPNQINLILFIITLFLGLMVKIDAPAWLNYGDPWDYLRQSHESLLDETFYSPPLQSKYYPRPFTVPLMYKIASSDPEPIIQLQKFLHALCTFFLCYVVFLYIRKTQVKIIFAVLWYFLMSWWNIVGWTHALLSESLSITFMFFWIASFLLFMKKRNFISIIFHILITILFSFTRDSWPYIIVLFYLIYAVIAIFWDKKIRAGVISFLVVGCVIFWVQQKSAQIGQRYRLPVMNNIVYRILPDEEYLKWFTDRGMPCAEELTKKYSNLAYFSKIYSLYHDSTLTKFSDWVAADGKSIYSKFLITHPSKLLLLNEKPKDLKRIFAYNLHYTGPVRGYSWISQSVFPFFNTIAILLLNGILIFLFFKEKRLVWVFPTVLMIIFTANAFMLYVADSLEVERHLFITNIVIQFLGILIVTFILDSETFIRGLHDLKKIMLQKTSKWFKKYFSRLV